MGSGLGAKDEGRGEEYYYYRLYLSLLSNPNPLSRFLSSALGVLIIAAGHRLIAIYDLLTLSQYTIYNTIVSMKVHTR